MGYLFIVCNLKNLGYCSENPTEIGGLGVGEGKFHVSIDQSGNSSGWQLAQVNWLLITKMKCT